MKRTILLLLAVVTAAVLVAGLTVTSNAATVNGKGISRAQLYSDLSAISQSRTFQCYLDASVLLTSNGTSSLPPINGTGQNGTKSSVFARSWLSTMVNNLLVEQLATAKGLSITPSILAIGRVDLVANISDILAGVGEQEGQAVCASGGSAILATLPKKFLGEEIRAQAAQDLVLASAAGYDLSQASLERYFASHRSQFDSICLSAIETSSEATATQLRSEIESGSSFASVAMASSQDTSTAPNGGALGCYTATTNGYLGISQDVSGLAVGGVSQPLTNGSSYVLFEVTSRTPTTFGAAAPAVRPALLESGSTKAELELSSVVHEARVTIDPRFGTWVHGSSILIRPPAVPPAATVLSTKA